jgi:hypothetical protein
MALEFEVIVFSVDIASHLALVFMGVATKRAPKGKEIVRLAGKPEESRGEEMDIFEIEMNHSCSIDDLQAFVKSLVK